MTNLTVNPEVLKRIALFSSLADEKLETLCQAVRHRRYARASMIVNVGESADGIYVLLAGRAKVIIENGNGNQVTLSVIEPNEFFGEMGVIDDEVRSACVEALEACETLYIPKCAFLKCIDGNFEAAMSLLRTVVGRLRNADRKIESLGLMDVYGRVARLLMESAEEVDGQWIVETGAEEIARTVAASREMVSRVVKEMRKKGLVRKEKRKTVILDRASMSASYPRCSSDQCIA